MNKNTIYIELEDDLTSLVQKVKNSPAENVALVPPKRSSLLQSAVNLKLIQKSALEAGKDLSVVTTDQIINTISARIGLKTAENLEKEPSVPQLHTPEKEIPSETIEEAAPASDAPAKDSAPKTKPIAKAGAGSSFAQRAKNKLKVPDFDKFKKRLVLGFLGLIILAGGWWLMAKSLPTAEVTVQGRTESLQTNFEFTASTTAEEVDIEERILPTRAEEATKTLTTTFKTTGEKDLGEKATGTITIKNCEDTDSRTLPGGTEFTAEDKTFLSDNTITVPAGEFSGGGASCDSSEISVGVTAESRGDSYNLAPNTYSTTALSGNFTITGDQMSGGSSKIAKVVSQKDADQAKSELLNKEKVATQQELATRFNEEYYLLEESFSQEVLSEKIEPGVDEEAEEGRVIIEVKYTMLGVQKEDITALLRHQQTEALGERLAEDRLGIVDEGLEAASITQKDSKKRLYSLETEALLGPDFNLEELKQELAGKGYNESLEYLKAFPNVTHAEIKLSPFWVFSMPDRPENITITLEVPEQSE